MSARRGVLVACLLLAACGGGDEQEVEIRGLPEPISGDRVPVLTTDQKLEVDAEAAGERVFLPRPYRNLHWPQPGAVPSHAIYHLALPQGLDLAWRADIGRGESFDTRLVGEPVVYGERVFTIDTHAQITAFDAQDGRQLWRTQITRKGEPDRLGFGGGVAYWQGRIYAATGHGILAALDAETGRVDWQFDAGVPMRGGPTARDGRVVTVTHDNQIFALDAETGEVLWEQLGLAEQAGVIGASSPVLTDDTAMVALSSGELNAYRVENGTVVWQDVLSRTRRMTPLATLSDIDGHPVVDRGRVFAISHSGRMVSIDLRSGERIWEKNLGGVSTPWVAGDNIYLVTTDNEVVGMTRAGGRIRWVTELQRFEDQEKREGIIRWTGPVLAGDRLVVVSSHGYALTLSPYTGEVLSARSLPAGTTVAPVVADQSLYILTSEGELLAFR
ncbi:hypothetical protein CCR85_08915 [Rhodothalassium salexigens]|uniref:outer membrane protein assembly factor BamB family protein n=1 Tax=Rhodothalassium salexigens TaxID=1086 RepID=UPI0019118AFC|nr:PQQ-binding-like beta-propeller repeat protein [Rhodothalassium salexigens]MBK5911608.1 hypothetical protein [Rhodothalassium salexigens]MBK5920901.1 hypothetical protein [Rhodothalassium salexigens]